MAKYTTYPILTEEFQSSFISMVEAAPVHIAGDMLQNSANILKERGADSQDFVLEINHDLATATSAEGGIILTPQKSAIILMMQEES